MPYVFSREMLVSDAYSFSIGEIGKRIKSIGSGSKWDHLADSIIVDQFVNDFMLEPIEWDSERQPWMPDDVTEHVVEEARSLSANHIRQLFLPIVRKKSNPRVLTLRPQSHWVQRGADPSRDSEYIESDAVIRLRGTVEDLSNMRSNAMTLIQLINAEVTEVYSSLRPDTERMLASRRRHLKLDASQLEADAKTLGVVIMRERRDAPRPVDVRVRQEVTIHRETIKDHRSVDYRLSPESLARIVDLIDRAGKGFEYAQREFRKLGEEGLRHIILGYLNAVFERPDATGETFSKDGRPDLVIMRDGHPILVGECKFWGGSKLYGSTLEEQLSRYVHWRHTAAVMITFSNQRSLQRVVTEAKMATEQLSSYVSTQGIRSETYFVTFHTHPDDEERNLEVHHLFFNLYSSREVRSPEVAR
jgi:hypothetical protein